MAYRFEAKVAARGYHIYRNLTWENVKPGDKMTVRLETNDELKKVDSYCCVYQSDGWSTSAAKNSGTHPERDTQTCFFSF